MRRESFTLTDGQFAALEKLAVDTKSTCVKGVRIGEPSWRALLRRVATGELLVVPAWTVDEAERGQDANIT